MKIPEPIHRCNNNQIHCNYSYGLVLILLEFHFVLLMYLTFVFYMPEDGHMIGQNM